MGGAAREIKGAAAVSRGYRRRFFMQFCQDKGQIRTHPLSGKGSDYLALVGLTRLDSNKYKAILRYKYQIGSQIKLTSSIIIPDDLKYNKRVDEFGEIVISRLQQPFSIEFSEEEIEKIISEYKSGKSTRKLAEQFNCSKTTIGDLLKRHGITVTNCKAQAKLDSERVIIMYKQEQTMDEIAKCFGVSACTIRKCLLKNNVKIRGRWDYKKE